MKYIFAWLSLYALSIGMAWTVWAHSTGSGAHSHPPKKTAVVVEFHIPEGTGNGPWNTPDNPVIVRIGQILRIINKDSVLHQLHALGEPCEHADDPIEPGQHYDCEITTEADPLRTVLYDHRYGSSARFYVKATK